MYVASLYVKDFYHICPIATFYTSVLVDLIVSGNPYKNIS